MASSGVAVSGYEILGVLDDSGSGRLYKARQKNLDRVVALKVLSASDSRDPSFVARFRSEAKAAAALRHPNVVSVCDQGTCPETGTHYVAYEYVEGPSAETLVTRLTALPEREALEMCYGVALGLACAEEHHIVHRDVQPSNIVLSQEGVPKLVELGLAKRTGDITTTAVGRMLKNAHYVSPEQALGLGELDTRADLYALGVCLYRFVTGLYPFEGSDGLTIVTKHVNEDLPDPRAVTPHLSEGLVRLINGLAARDPADRYESARAASHDIGRVLDGLTALGPAETTRSLAAAVTPPRPSDSRVMQGLLSRSSVQLARELARGGPDLEETPLVYRIEMFTGDVLLQEHKFDKDVVVIGRGKDCEIHIDNPIVSRRHAEFRRSGGKLALVALPTTNGTSVDGNRVEDMTPVDERSRILVADKFRLVVKFERLAPRVVEPPPTPEEDETTTFKASNAVRDLEAREAEEEAQEAARASAQASGARVRPEPTPLASKRSDPQPVPSPPPAPPPPTPHTPAPAPVRVRPAPEPEAPSPSRSRPAVPAFGREVAAPPGVHPFAPLPEKPAASPYDASPYEAAPSPYDVARTPHEEPTEPNSPAVSRAAPSVLEATPPTGSQRRPALPTLRDSGRHRRPERSGQRRPPALIEDDSPSARPRPERATVPLRASPTADGAVLLVQKNGKEQRISCGESFQVGKAKECDLRLEGGFAPRKAALILRQRDGWWVFNVGPAPDTVLLNGAEIPDRSPLNPGDRLVIYGLEARFAVG